MQYFDYVMAKYASEEQKKRKRDGARLLTQIGGGLVGLKGGAALGSLAGGPLLFAGKPGLAALAMGTGLVGGTYAGVKGAGKLYDWYTSER